MSNKKEHIIFPEMPEKPDMSDVPIIQDKSSYSWCPTKENLLMIILPILVLLLAVVGVYTWSRYDFSGSDQVQAEINRLWGQPSGFGRIWNQLTGQKMPWQ